MLNDTKKDIVIKLDEKSDASSLKCYKDFDDDLSTSHAYLHLLLKILYMWSQRQRNTQKSVHQHKYGLALCKLQVAF